MVCLNVIVAESVAEAELLATSQQQFFLNVVRAGQRALQPPVSSMDGLWTPDERAAAQQMLACSLVGSRQTVAHQLEALQIRLRADELMVVSYVFDEQKQLDSYRMLKEIVE